MELFEVLVVVKGILPDSDIICGVGGGEGHFA